MGYGDGSIYKRADGLWVAAVPLPPGSDGRRRRKVIARKSKADAIAERRRVLAELARSGDLETASPTVEAWLRYWLDHIARDRLKPETLTGYRRKVERYIIPTLGRHRLSKLTARQVRGMHDHMTGEMGLSSTTALQAHRILAVALKDAVREGKVSRNVADSEHVDAPRKAVNVRPALTADEGRAVLVTASRGRAGARWGLALLAGLRQGEALGVTRDAIDLQAGLLTVQWQLQRLTWQHGCTKPGRPATCGRRRGGDCPKRTVHIPPDQEATQVRGGLWLTRPKSRAGWREVPIVGGLAEVLADYLATTPPGPNGLIFHDDGRPIDPSDDAAAWDAICRAADVPDVPLHSARHTCSSLLARLGAPEDVRMQILGHSSATVTRGYTHRTTAEAREWMTSLSEMLAAPRLAPAGADG